jgi:hypothetical protein
VRHAAHFRDAANLCRRKIFLAQQREIFCNPFFALYTQKAGGVLHKTSRVQQR